MSLVYAFILNIWPVNKTNYIILFLIYFLGYTLKLFEAIFISTFFKNSKKGIIVSLLAYFLLYLFWIIGDKCIRESRGLTIFISFFLVNNYNFIFSNILSF